LAKSIADAGNVVLAMKTSAGGFEELQPLPMFADQAYATGFVDLPLDSDGFVRSTQLVLARPNQAEKFSFATRLVEGYLTATAPEGTPPQYLEPGTQGNPRLGQRQILTRNDRNLQIDFRGHSPAFHRVSAADILFKQATLPADLFRDRIVLIGAANIDAPDLFATPYYEYSALSRLLDRSLPAVPKRMPGVEIHANAASTILFGKMLKHLSYLRQIVALLLALAVVAFAVFRLRPLLAFGAVIMIAILALAVSSWSFNSSRCDSAAGSIMAGNDFTDAVGTGPALRARTSLAQRNGSRTRAGDGYLFALCLSRRGERNVGPPRPVFTGRREPHRHDRLH
jgi:CHASE2 domain-containing sensor protein